MNENEIFEALEEQLFRQAAEREARKRGINLSGLSAQQLEGLGFLKKLRKSIKKAGKKLRKVVKKVAPAALAVGGMVVGGPALVAGAKVVGSKVLGSKVVSNVAKVITGGGGGADVANRPTVQYSQVPMNTPPAQALQTPQVVHNATAAAQEMLARQGFKIQTPESLKLLELEMKLEAQKAARQLPAVYNTPHPSPPPQNTGTSDMMKFLPLLAIPLLMKAL